MKTEKIQVTKKGILRIVKVQIKDKNLLLAIKWLWRYLTW